MVDKQELKLIADLIDGVAEGRFPQPPLENLDNALVMLQDEINSMNGGKVYGVYKEYDDNDQSNSKVFFWVRGEELAKQICARLNALPDKASRLAWNEYYEDVATWTYRVKTGDTIISDIDQFNFEISQIYPDIKLVGQNDLYQHVYAKEKEES